MKCRLWDIETSNIYVLTPALCPQIPVPCSTDEQPKGLVDVDKQPRQTLKKEIQSTVLLDCNKTKWQV